MSRTAALLLAGLLTACAAAAPPPPIMGQVREVGESPAAKEAQALAPGAYALAQKLERAAQDAHSEEDTASAQILSEHAMAAYTHAFVLARITKAQARLDAAKSKATEAQTTLAKLDADNKQAAAEAADLEMRVNVARDAIPLPPNAPTTPEREAARLQAARSLASQALLLCAAGQLLDGKNQAISKSLKAISKLESELGKTKSVPIDTARRVRSACLGHLSQLRRGRSGSVAANLLTELVQLGGLAPVRDERGVVATLRDLFDRTGKLKPNPSLEALGKVAQAHPKLPVLVVVHTAYGEPTKADRQRGELVAAALRKAGAPNVRVETSGGRQPVVPRGGKEAAARNARVEIAFITR